MKKLLDLFIKPSARTLARRDLEEAERELHEARKSEEMWRHSVKLYTERVRRLRADLNAYEPSFVVEHAAATPALAVVKDASHG